MARWATQAEGDVENRVDGDRGFLRMRSRLDGARLEAGELELSENGRLDRGTFRPRLGAERLNESFTDIVAPLTLPFTLGDRTLSNLSITRSGTTATVTTDGIHGFETGEIIAIDGADPDEYNGNHEITKISSTEFTYEVSGSPTSPAIAPGTSSDGPVLESVYDDGVFAAGVFANPNEEYKEYIVLATGRRIFLMREGEALTSVQYEGTESISPGQLATVVDANHKVYIFRDGERALEWDGAAAEVTMVDASAPAADFDRMPQVGWGLWFANRMFVPYPKALPSTVDPGEHESPAAFIVSEVLDPDNYDLIDGLFLPNIGWSDYIVGLHPYQEDSVLVFMRKSVHLVSGILGDLANATVSEVTREVGCISRQSIVTAGHFVFFLSDNGVYALEIGRELKLRGALRPLSDSIQDVMETVPLAEAEAASGVFYNNRYYLAVPGEGTDGRANRILVYSILNEGWESLDVYPEALWLDWVVLAFWEGKRRMFGANFESFVYLLEEVDGSDEVGTPGEEAEELSPVVAKARSRVYEAESAIPKLWLRAQAEIDVADGPARVRALSRAPEHETEWVTFAQGAQRLKRAPLRLRGAGVQLEAELTEGKGEIFAWYVEGMETGRSMVGY